ncbi:LbetaH domain-containing protein [Halobacterium litoreum]|uniref:SipW-cognate class signal peptide n=1 Tax=Halobacterium litoreum TaxID=2039234 RepID=A0ABD5NCM8_9EURY|nr:hypothetical protein [Halobacterium litoreum]UHH14061.1 hypothetical protein LT972_03445 [Halobacterium litoreum]
MSRRTLLRGLGAAGAASVGAATGVATHATLRDGEPFGTLAAESGTLDLDLATRSVADGDVTEFPTQDGPFPSSFASEPTATVDFGTVDPERGRESGHATLAFRVCGNPGRVWFRPVGSASGLADELHVELSHAATCGDPGATLYEGSLSGLFDALGDGVQLGAGCVRLGRVELEGGALVGPNDSLAVDDVPGALTFDGPDGPVEIEVTAGHFKDDGELRGVDLASPDAALCRVDVKGGGKQTGSRDGVETYRLDCADGATDLLAGTNPGGRPSGLSHFDVYACADGDCVGCEPACLELDWTLRNPREVAGESLTLDFELFARQCRHSDARNPWR